MRVTLANGNVTEVSTFHVTGRLYNSTRYFKRKTYPATFEGFRTAMSINLWRGSVWGVHATTSVWKLIKRV